VADDKGLAEYQSKVEPHPATDGEVLTTIEWDSGRFESYDFPAVYPGRVNFWNIIEQAQTAALWKENSTIIDQHTIGCLKTSDEETSVQVSLRASSSPAEPGRRLSPGNGRNRVIKTKYRGSS